MFTKCQNCGKEFNARPDKIKKGEGKFCSYFCASNIKKRLIKRKCQICDKEFEIRLSQFKKTGGRFCSRSCANVVLNSNRKKSPLIKKCVVCDTEIKTSAYMISKGQGKFCSIKCKNTGHSLKMQKENNPSWKGGITPILLVIRTSKKYQEWRQQIFIRDNFTCKECGQIGGELHAHHKKRFSTFINEIRYNLPLLSLYEAAMIYESLWDIGNGITLCKKCHCKKRRK